MLEWVRVVVILGVVAILSSGLFVLVMMFWRRFFCCFNQQQTNLNHHQDFVIDNNQNKVETCQEGIAKLQQDHHQWSMHHNLHHHHHVDSKRRGKNSTFRLGVSTKPLFNWTDHPSLITDAVENGWSRFGFTTSYMPSPSTKSSSILGLCAVGENGRETEPEISWEVCQGSADFMQKIRLNPGLKKINYNNTNSLVQALSVIRAALPLPGPALGTSAFPQEAYFEITILCSRNNDYDSIVIGKESERTKLIKENSNAHANSESFVHVTSGNNRSIINMDEVKLYGVKDVGKVEAVTFSIGLTAGGSLPSKLPGSYPGSIGFNSNGSVYLDGIKLVFQSETAEWGRTDKVIGCGFNPREKKVFFTVDSELAHVIHCKSEEFGTPLYPTLAANTDILVMVNHGQSVFSYPPANAHRTANPCFIGPLVRNSSAAAAVLGYEDSKELFSMGRIDSQWLTRSAYLKGSVHSRAMDFDEESDADLFEIVLESSSGKSPNPNIILKP